jgi:hypothetical protein
MKPALPCGNQRSADFQSAVSQVSNLRHVEIPDRNLGFTRQPIGNRRYSRLETLRYFQLNTL